MCVLRIKVMHSHVNSKNGQRAPLIAKDVFDIVMQVSQTECAESEVAKWLVNAFI